jgi:hypothetical protein
VKKPKKQNPYLPPTTKQLLKDAHRHSGKGMVWKPEDEGPYDRHFGKDMLAEEDAAIKRRVQKISTRKKKPSPPI